MSLLVWLPLNGNLENQGLSNVTVTNNGATVDSNGKIGKCYSFSSSNSAYLQLPQFSINRSEMSFCIWAKYGAWDYFSRLFDFGATSGAGDTLLLSHQGTSNNFYVGCKTGGTSRDFSYAANLSLNTWYHFAVIKKGLEWKLYLNGNLVYTTNLVSDFSTDPVVFKNNFLGRSNWSQDTYLTGQLNDFRIYDHALSPKEVGELAKGLVLHYRLAGPGQENLITGNFSCTSTNTTYKSQGTIGCVLTAADLMANQGRTLTLSYDVYSLGDYTQNVAGSWSANRFGIHGVVRYTRNGSSTSTQDYPLASLLSRGRKGRIFTSWTIPTGITSFDTDLTFNIQTDGRNGYAYPASNNSSTWYLKNVKLEWGSIATPWCPNPADALYRATGYSTGIEYDCSGYKHNGTPVSATVRPVWDVDSPRYTTSFKYDGNVNRVNYTTSTDMNFTDNFSWAIWINPNYTSDKTQFVFTGGRADAGGFGYGLEVTSTTSCRIFYGNNGRYPVEAKSGEWHHVAFTKSGTTCKCYLDGALVSTNTFSGTNPTYSDGNGVGIGCFHYGGNIYPYFGKASDFRIYATALSAEDIAELYHTSAMVDNNGNAYAYEYLEA